MVYIQIFGAILLECAYFQWEVMQGNHTERWRFEALNDESWFDWKLYQAVIIHHLKTFRLNLS